MTELDPNAAEIEKFFEKIAFQIIDYVIENASSKATALAFTKEFTKRLMITLNEVKDTTWNKVNE